MDTLAILVPTYRRAAKLKDVIKNIHEATITPHTIYFLLEPDDSGSIAEVGLAKEQYIINDSEVHNYVAAVNLGFKKTTEELVFCAADDLKFQKGWDKAIRKAAKDPELGFFGASDDWVITKTQKHSSHFAVRRSYIETQGGVEDERGTIYFSGYQHLMCDIETEQTAQKRGAFIWLKDCRVEHLHWFTNQAQKDQTYQRASDSWSHDIEIYNQRRSNFEQYIFESLFEGQVVPVKKSSLSIVLPSFNALEYLKQTIKSLEDNTFNNYQLIIIDDNSNIETKAYINSLSHVPLIRIENKNNLFTNANWNTGIKHARGDYIAIINNDITFSKNWDLHLIAECDKLGVGIASPYQTTGELKAYGVDPTVGSLIRGACFMAKKEVFNQLGSIPNDMLMWCGESWFEWRCKQLKLKCSFVQSAVIHHFVSQSSKELQDTQAIYWWIVRGDILAYEKITGEELSLPKAMVYHHLGLY